MTQISDKRLEILIRYAEQTSKSWLCVEVVAALGELQDFRKRQPRATPPEHDNSTGNWWGWNPHA